MTQGRSTIVEPVSAVRIRALCDTLHLDSYPGGTMRSIRWLLLALMAVTGACSRHPAYGVPRPHSPSMDTITQGSDTANHHPTP